MAKKIAVAVIHGMGSQAQKAGTPTDKPTFSKDLKKYVRRSVGNNSFDQNIAWREIRYADITQKNQDVYFKKIRRKVRSDSIRSFIIKNLGDVAAYKYDRVPSENKMYETVHKRVDKTIGELKADTAINAPLVVLAHSLGGHVISNHIWDCQKLDPQPANMQCMNTMASFITFGCNIPIFTFGTAPSQIKAIKNPGSKLPSKFKTKTWWKNFYDKDDSLGYPLIPTGKGYEALGKSKQLADKAINAGGIFTSWNPLSHTSYWRDNDVIDPIAKELKRLIGA